MRVERWYRGSFFEWGERSIVCSIIVERWNKRLVVTNPFRGSDDPGRTALHRRWHRVAFPR